jgi:hypothetical protein
MVPLHVDRLLVWAVLGSTFLTAGRLLGLV